MRTRELVPGDDQERVEKLVRSRKFQDWVVTPSFSGPSRARRSEGNPLCLRLVVLLFYLCQGPTERGALYKSHGSGQLLTQLTIVVFWPNWCR